MTAFLRLGADEGVNPERLVAVSEVRDVQLEFDSRYAGSCRITLRDGATAIDCVGGSAYANVLSKLGTLDVLVA